MFIFFFFNDTATTEIYTLSLHDALPIFSNAAKSPRKSGMRTSIVQVDSSRRMALIVSAKIRAPPSGSSSRLTDVITAWRRSEEHTSELQSLAYIVCRLLLEKKKIPSEGV